LPPMLPLEVTVSKLPPEAVEAVAVQVVEPPALIKSELL